MEKRVFRSWEDKRVLVFLIISSFLVPFLLISSIMIFKDWYNYNPLIITYAILSIFAYICIVTLLAISCTAFVILVPEGILLNNRTLIILSYKQISSIKFIYSKRDKQGNTIKPLSVHDTRMLTPKTYIEVVLNSGERHRLNVDGLTNRLVIKILEEIKVRALKYSDALKDFDPVSAVKKTKYTFKEPKDSFIDSNKLR